MAGVVKQTEGMGKVDLDKATADKNKRPMTLQEAKEGWRMAMGSSVNPGKKCRDLQLEMENLFRKAEREEDPGKLMAIHHEFESKRDELARLSKDWSSYEKLYKKLAEETIKITAKSLPKEEHELYLEWLVETEIDSGLDERKS